MKRWTGRTLWGFGIVAFVLMGSFMVWRNSVLSEWEAAVREWEAVGGTLDPLPAPNLPLVAAEDNGVVQYIQAYQLLKNHTDETAQRELPLDQLETMTADEIEAWYDAEQARSYEWSRRKSRNYFDMYLWPELMDGHLPVLHEVAELCYVAAEKPARVWTGDVIVVEERPMPDSYPDYVTTRELRLYEVDRVLSDALDMHFTWNLEQGSPAGAIRDLEAIHSFMKSQPNHDMSPQNPEHASTSLIFIYHDLEEMVRRGLPEAYAFESRFAQHDLRAARKKGMVYHVATILNDPSFERSKREHFQVPVLRELLTKHAVAGLLRNATQAMRQVDLPLQECEWNDAQALPELVRYMASFSSTHWRMCSHLTRQRFYLAACELHRFHEAHGRYPEPSEWDVPEDPFTGDPMVYELTAEGYLLQSVGTMDRHEEYSIEWRGVPVTR